MLSRSKKLRETETERQAFLIIILEMEDLRETETERQSVFNYHFRTQWEKKRF